MRIYVVIVSGLAAFLIAGCGSSYIAPPPGADLAVLGAQRVAAEEQRRVGSDPAIRVAMDRKPLAGFPASIAVARVQSSGYFTKTAEGFGRGAYSVVTQRDIESDADFEKLGKLPMIAGIAPVSRLLLPQVLNSDAELRTAAASLRADMLLVYTIDTSFLTKDANIPARVITLGALQPAQADVRTTASAVLMDTRNGYIYGVAEAAAREEKRVNNWTSEAEVDRFRIDNEKKAFAGLVGELEKTWGGVVNRYAPNPSGQSAAGR